MNARILSLTVFTLALAVVFGFGAINNSNAALTDSFNLVAGHEVNLTGVDEANNGIGTASDKDAGPSFSFQTYGLSGDWATVR